MSQRRTIRKTDPLAFLSHLKSATQFDADVAELRRVLSYDQDTGELRWKVSPSNNVKAGALVANRCNRYLRVCVKWTNFFAHVLAWIYVYGRLPEGDLDHVNGVGTDNRLCNLRDVSKSSNAQNQKRAHKQNLSGLLGVRHAKGDSAYIARIRHQGSSLYLGSFKTAEDAHQAYVTAKRRLHEGCTL